MSGNACEIGSLAAIAEASGELMPLAGPRQPFTARQSAHFCPAIDSIDSGGATTRTVGTSAIRVC